MKKKLAHLTVEAVKAIHEEVLAAHGGAPGLRDEALLASAIAAPRATMLGKPLLKSAVEIAAAYLFYPCRNHPFIDGNKRTALGACLVFLAENRILREEELDCDAWEAFVLDLAGGDLDRDQTTRRLRQLLAAQPPRLEAT